MSPKFHNLTHRLLDNVRKDDMDLVRSDLLDMLVELNEMRQAIQRKKAKAEAEQIFEACSNPAYSTPDPYEEARNP